MITKKHNTDDLKNLFFILPALSLFILFYIYPFFYTVILSFYQGDGISAPTFVGLANFKDLICSDTEWWRAMRNSGYITLWALTLQNILALALALTVNKLTRTAPIYRTIFFILPIISEIIIGLLMREILKSDPGIFNRFLNNVGLQKFAFDWLGEGQNTKVLLTTALVHCWKGFGWAFVIILAGLSTIPEQLYENAQIDGANSWQRLTKITLPMLMPVISLVFILTILGTMQSFAVILALTRGAGGLTEVPVMRIYDHLRGNQIGLACAEGILLGMILIGLSFTILFIARRLKERYSGIPS